MKKLLIAAVAALSLASCSQEPTIQKYFVESSEKPNFVTLDIAPSIIKADSLDLSKEEKTALESLDKLNILMYKRDDKNAKVYAEEKASVKKLLKEDQYEELMKFSSADGSGGSINTKGEGENIDEFAVMVYNDDTGFGVVRVLGEDMTPTHVMTIAGLLQKANLDMAQLKPLQEMLKKK